MMRMTTTRMVNRKRIETIEMKMLKLQLVRFSDRRELIPKYGSLYRMLCAWRSLKAIATSMPLTRNWIATFSRLYLRSCAKKLCKAKQWNDADVNQWRATWMTTWLF